MRLCGLVRRNEDQYYRAVNSEKCRQSGQGGVRRYLLADLAYTNLKFLSTNGCIEQIFDIM
jgi:hypothetical protein